MKAPKDYLILIGLSLIWGTSYILIKKGLTVFTPYQVANLRLGISALALAPLAIRHLPKVPRRRLPLLFLVGLTGTALPSFLFPFAQQYLSSSLTGMLSGLNPLCTLLIAWLAFRNQPLFRQGLGVALGLIGAAWLALAAPEYAGHDRQLIYGGIVVLACLCYGTAANLVANYFPDTSSLTITVISFFLVGFPALLWSLTGGGILTSVTSNGTAGYRALLYVGVLALGSTVLASIVFFRLIQRTGPIFASTVSYLIPVVALAWGLLDGEALSFWQLPAALLVLVGVFLSKRK